MERYVLQTLFIIYKVEFYFKDRDTRYIFCYSYDLHIIDYFVAANSVLVVQAARSQHQLSVRNLRQSGVQGTQDVPEAFLC